MIDTAVIVLLDKAWPPEHSFVDGMLASVVPQHQIAKVNLIVSKGTAENAKPKKYFNATCIPLLYERRGVGRVINFFLAVNTITKLVKHHQKKKRKVVVWVRNEPIYLLSAAITKGSYCKLVFQSSYPHERYSGNHVMRFFARFLYQIAGRNVDSVTGVSPAGTLRAQKYCPNASYSHYIPLMSDLPVSNTNSSILPLDEMKKPVFVYIGTHAAKRQQEVILRGIKKVVQQGGEATFLFVGATDEDEERLVKMSQVQQLIKDKVIHFIRPVSRLAIPNILSHCDVGLSLVPPNDENYEMSPTKLAEYMGAGLAVLASNGVALQEKFVSDSNSGYLVDWHEDSIANGILSLLSPNTSLTEFKESSKYYAENFLKYEFFIEQFKALISNNER
ncbi:glycosyltransferase [Oceanisphaera ostreae]|uniref:Glycosyltransferase n=1 Tax=Oceanisphaera ostreae TaxID=914151 RepID=A0ABW3KHN9_9GAMM